MPELREPPSPDQLLTGLDPEQVEVARNLHGPLCVLAGAGTGKTRAITHRIAYGVATGVFQPTNVLALTFTARAAGQMRSRLRDLGVLGAQARTFHSAALRQLTYFWPRILGGEVPQLVKQKARLVAQAANSVRVATDPAAVRDLAGEIEWAKVSLHTAESYQVAAAQHNRVVSAPLTPEVVCRVMTAYEDLKTEQGLLDFEDILVTAAALLRNYPQAGDAVRRQYRHLVVDEFQDTSPAQAELLKCWLGDSQNVCVVGDAGQTIYSFAGANPTLLTQFGRTYPEATVIRLVRNYRCPAPVVELANRVLAGAPAEQRRPYVRLQAAKTGAETPVLRCVADDDEEARDVAEAVAGLLAHGKQAADVAVLFRTNSQSEPLERALAQRGVPVVLRGGERFFARDEVRKALVALRGAVHAHAEDHRPVGEIVRDVLTSVGWTAAEPTGTGAVRERWESWQALVAMADDMARQRPGSMVVDVVAELDDRAEAQHAPTVQGVTLASLHSAKGLEWDHVFLVGVSDGLLPISLAARPEDVEEERRLLYVGVTRARESLALSYAQSRHGGSRGTRKVSRFLTDHGKFLKVTRSRAATPEHRTSGTSRLCRVCGEALTTKADRSIGRCATCPSSYDEALFEELRRWRKETADMAGVPAFVICTDASLTVVAEKLPTSRDELLAVPGFGATKVSRFGDDIVAIVANFSGQRA